MLGLKIIQDFVFDLPSSQSAFLECALAMIKVARIVPSRKVRSAGKAEDVRRFRVTCL